MKNRTHKLYKAIELLAALYNLDADKLLKGAVQQHTLYQTLERIGYNWNGVRWNLKERPWMLPYRRIQETPAEAGTTSEEGDAE